MIMSKEEFYARDVDNPHSVNGFRGTWQFSDHRLIPDVLHDFLQRYFGVYRIRRVPLEQINQVMNDIWEGPGSLAKVFALARELRDSKDIEFTRADIAAIKAKRSTDIEDDEPNEVLEGVPLNAFSDFGDND